MSSTTDKSSKPQTKKTEGKTIVTTKGESTSSWSGQVTSRGKTTSVKVNSISNLLARCAAME